MKLTAKTYAKAYLQAVGEAPINQQRAMANNFWQIVWRHGHFKWHKNILASLKELLREQKGIKLAQVITAKPLDAPAEHELMSKLTQATGYNIELVQTVKPHLLAGLVVTIDDNRYDASLKGRLDALYSKLAGEK